MSTLVHALEWFFLLYFVAVNAGYIMLNLLAIPSLQRKVAVRPLENLPPVYSGFEPPVSILVPAYNEEAMIASSVRSLLQLEYPEFEVIVVNDGSKDGTLAALQEAFQLEAFPEAHWRRLKAAPVRAIYHSRTHPNLRVVDKENGGGKADAINAGINAARHPLVCVIDADSILEPHALTRAVLPFLEDPSTLAAGGIIRIVNGCTVEAGQVTEVRLPASRLALFQVVEYLRAFLAGRVALSAANMLLIISGAFGIFRRDALVEAGGFRADTVGEDMEIVTRLHRLYRERKARYRIVFQPDPVCWTEAPEDPRILRNQRNRWQRGTMQVLGYHRAMIGNPRYGAVGLLAMPYYLLFETLGPAIECTGFIVTIAALLLGLLDWRFAELLFLAAIVYGAIISLAAVLLEELSFRRYPRVRDLLVLALAGIGENFGYRQLTTWWRLVGMRDYFRRSQGWGTMTRKGFSRS